VAEGSERVLEGDTVKISESTLRQLIREQLLAESAMTPSDASRKGLSIRIKKRFNYVDIIVSEGRYGFVGGISSTPMGNPCGEAWTVDGSEVHIDGLGPLLYDLMLDVIHPHPLTSDRVEVSWDARSVWDYYLHNRPDIESIQLDDLKNTLTPEDSDNCEQNSSMIWGDDLFGDEGRWPDSSLSKAYRRKGGGTPVLDELRSLGVIRVFDEE